MRHRYCFINIVLILTLVGCGQSDLVEIPEPTPVMVEQRTVSYSGRAELYVNTILVEMRRRFGRQYKFNDQNSFSVPTELRYEEILEYYTSYFNQFDKWQKIDASELEWDIYSITHGWKSKNDIFLLLTHTQNDDFLLSTQTSERDTSSIPHFAVFTLTSL